MAFIWLVAGYTPGSEPDASIGNFVQHTISEGKLAFSLPFILFPSFIIIASLPSVVMLGTIITLRKAASRPGSLTDDIYVSTITMLSAAAVAVLIGLVAPLSGIAAAGAFFVGIWLVRRVLTAGLHDAVGMDFSAARRLANGIFALACAALLGVVFCLMLW